MRDAIDQSYADKEQYPSTLDALVTDGYMRQVPEIPLRGAGVAGRPSPPSPTRVTRRPSQACTTSTAARTAPRSTAANTPSGSHPPSIELAPSRTDDSSLRTRASRFHSALSPASAERAVQPEASRKRLGRARVLLASKQEKGRAVKPALVLPNRDRDPVLRSYERGLYPIDVRQLMW